MSNKKDDFGVFYSSLANSLSFDRSGDYTDEERLRSNSSKNLINEKTGHRHTVESYVEAMIERSGNSHLLGKKAEKVNQEELSEELKKRVLREAQSLIAAGKAVSKEGLFYLLSEYFPKEKIHNDYKEEIEKLYEEATKEKRKNNQIAFDDLYEEFPLSYTNHKIPDDSSISVIERQMNKKVL